METTKQKQEFGLISRPMNQMFSLLEFKLKTMASFEWRRISSVKHIFFGIIEQFCVFGRATFLILFSFRIHRSIDRITIFC